MSYLSVVLRLVPLAVALACAARLAGSAASRWSTQRAGRVYELPEDYRPAVRRATACGLVLVTGIVLTIALPGALLGAPERPGVSGTGSPSAHEAVAAKADFAPPRPRALPDHRRPVGANRPLRPAASASVSTFPSPAASPAASVSASAGPVRSSPGPLDRFPGAGGPSPRTLGRPGGGSLQLLADGTRVWLPPQYAYPKSADLAFPMVVAYLPAVAADREALYPAFARQVALGRADPFVVVEPSGCSADPLAAVLEAARYYRLLDGVRARGVLGVGPLAPCAVRAALRHPEVFGAYVGVSGTYDRAAVPLPGAAPAIAPRLLLTSAHGELPQRRSAYALRTALRPLGVRARIVDSLTADPLLGGGARRREFAVAAEYLTDQLDGPGRVSPARTSPR